MSTKPDPESWTLRFKYGKSTILLHVHPDTPFATIKSDLISAIASLDSSSTTRTTLEPLPSSASAIAFAVPNDKNDLSKGWVPLEIVATAIEVNGGSSSKGMNSSGKEVKKDVKKESRLVGGSDSILNRDPRSAGLKDGAVLAFRFASKHELDSGEVDENARWNVQVPTWDDEEEVVAAAGDEGAMAVDVPAPSSKRTTKVKNESPESDEKDWEKVGS